MFILALFLALAAQASDDTPAELKPRQPRLASVFPQGAAPGSRLQAEVLGQFLDRAAEVVFLDSSIRGRIVSGSFTKLTLEIEVGKDAAFGPHYFRVTGPRGASNVLLFRAGDLPHVNEVEPNSTRAQAQLVSMPMTINGRLNEDGDFDFFRFHAEKGQTLVLDLRAARNGNGLDAALILMDASGRKLEHSEDVFIWDPLITHTFDAAGDYIAVVQPTHTHNDPTFGYQLDIRATPHLQSMSPVGVRPDSEIEATIYGSGLTDPRSRLWFDAPGFSGSVLEMRGTSALARIRVPAGAAEGVRQLVLVNSGGRSSPVSFAVDATPAHAGGTQLHLPTAVNGSAKYKEAERFWFEAKAGESIYFEVRAQRFGSPADASIRILDSSGNQLAANDDGSFPGVAFNKDSRLLYRFERADRYQIEIRNLWKVTGENFPYQLIARAPKPFVDLLLDSTSPYVFPGQDGKLKVSAERQEGHAGAIALSTGSGMADGANSTEVPLLAGSARPGECHALAVTAQGTARPAWKFESISSGGGEGSTQAAISGALFCVVEKPTFELEAAVTNVNLVRGAQAELPVTIRRAAGSGSALRFDFENLPDGVSAEGLDSGAGSTSVRIRLSAGSTAKPGRYSRVAVLARSPDGEVQEAPKITIQID